MVGWLVDWGMPLTSASLCSWLILFTLYFRAAASLLEVGLASLFWGYSSALLRLLHTKIHLLLLKILLFFPRDLGWTHMSSDNIASADTYLDFVNINQERTGLGRGLGLNLPSYWVILTLLGVFQDIIQNREAPRGGIATPSRNNPQLGCYETPLEQGHPLGGSHTHHVDAGTVRLLPTTCAASFSRLVRLAFCFHSLSCFLPPSGEGMSGWQHIFQGHGFAALFWQGLVHSTAPSLWMCLCDIMSSSHCRASQLITEKARETWDKSA